MSTMVSRAGSATALRARADGQEIRRLIDERVSAIRSKNVDAVLAQYAPDVTTFDLLEPLAHRGVDGVRERLQGWFASFSATIDYDITGIELELSGDVAFDHHFVHVRGKNVDGAVIDMWFRETVGWRKEGGQWKVAHQHSSVPLDMSTMKGVIHLDPNAA